MGDRIAEYLGSRADLVSRPLVTQSSEGVDQAVVIPALAEKDSLFQTLESLAGNPARELRRTLMICVVNNRAAPFASADEIEDNRRTIENLDAWVRGKAAPELMLGYIDAASPGRELPKKGGVGMARKIGLDWALAVVARGPSPHRLLFSLDADTLVEPNYLEAVRAHFEANNAWGAVTAYAHRLEGPPEQIAAIVCYELVLRYHVLGLSYAGSPYAFPSIGSTMVCRAEAYAAVSGMNQRQAGEDFYFLQQLAKTGGVDQIAATTVYPSARPSPRVPFGTGQRVRRFLDGGQDEYLVYDPCVYRILRDWLDTVRAHCGEAVDDLSSRALGISAQLGAFLDENRFRHVWPRLRENARDDRQLLEQFHRWFDGFRTLKLIHYIRDHGCSQRDMFESIAALLKWIGGPVSAPDPAGLAGNIEAQKALLADLRDRASRNRV